MYCFVILLLFNEMQMSVRRFSAIPHLRGNVSGVGSNVAKKSVVEGERPCLVWGV